MKKIIFLIFVYFNVCVEISFSQTVEIITKERAIEICDSLKKIKDCSFDHVLKTAWSFENTEEYREYFFYCINTISNGYRIPTQPIDPDSFNPIDDGNQYLIDWHGKLINNGCSKAKEKVSLGEKIYIYYNLPKPFEVFTDGTDFGPDPYDSNSGDVYIGYICSPNLCITPDTRPKITRD